jgi:hypothetical protein
MILDDETSGWLKRSDRFEAEVVPAAPRRRRGDWKRLDSPDELVSSDPTDVFGDLASARRSFPHVIGGRSSRRSLVGPAAVGLLDAS